MRTVAGVLGCIISFAAVAKTTPKKPAAARPAPRVQRLYLGEAFDSGDVRYVVRSVTPRRDMTSAYHQLTAPSGAWFVLVWYTVENIGLNPLRDRPMFYMRDGKGRRYTVDEEAHLALSRAGVADGYEVDTFDHHLQPGVRKKFVAAFTLPDDAFESGYVVFFPISGDFDFAAVSPVPAPAAREERDAGPRE